MVDPVLLQELPDIAAQSPEGDGDREQAAATHLIHLAKFQSIRADMKAVIHI